MATGTIIIKNPNGKSGTFRVVTVGNDDECPIGGCQGQDLHYVDPHNSGVQQGGGAIGKVVQAGNSGVYIVINIQPHG